MKNLSAAAHLIHGSPEGRFTVTYAPGGLTKEEVESVGFEYDELEAVRKRYRTDELKDGWNDVDGERIYYISNPAIGLWAYRGHMAGVEHADAGSGKHAAEEAEAEGAPPVKRARVGDDGEEESKEEA
eukprot:PLAT1091.1.p1 GENE.PLAT1091.1~~PLAT1091.1.p1  ORF type:complete len:142 (+),score=45.61 PLAT1091.1:44-427(+)